MSWRSRLACAARFSAHHRAESGLHGGVEILLDSDGAFLYFLYAKRIVELK